MNEKITFQQLAEQLSLLTGGSQATTETFIRELFAVVSEALSHGENVKIKNIGTFSPSGITEQPILFAPDKDLAEAINMPFACFEAVELNDDVTEDILNDILDDTTTQIEEENVDIQQKELVYSEDKNQEIEPENIGVTIIENVALIECNDEEGGEQDNTPIEEQIRPAESTEYEIEVESDCVDEPECLSDIENGERTNSRRSFMWLIVLISLIVGVFAGYVIGSIFPYYFVEVQNTQVTQKELPENPQNLVSEIHVTSKIDTIMNIIEQPAVIPEVVTDTIRTTRFLTTMARQYYGEMIFWVYIYEENKEKLDNPNRIKPGTVVVIPDAEKYGINKNDSACVANAKLKAMEIYAPYQK